MKNAALNYTVVSLIIVSSLCACKPSFEENDGKTEIAQWYQNKTGAVSLTFDDGTIHQFTIAMPMLDSLGMKGTFYIITGKIPESQYRGTFIGRPGEEIIAETAKIPTNKDNLLERASAIGFLGYEGGLDYHTRAGAAVDAENVDKAIEIIEEGYAKIRSGKLKKVGPPTNYIDANDTTTWAQYKQYAAKGHEIASHTVTHPRLAILDEPNILYELEKSKEEIQNQIGRDYIFSAEGPYGTEHEHSVEYVLKVYKSARNRMPEPFLAELNRGSKKSPAEGKDGKEYVQWQRGPLFKTPMELMKSWVDTTAARNDTWLVLVFHGVEGVGWEAKPKEQLKDYFEYIADKRDDVWVAPFVEVAQYIRERMAAKVGWAISEETISLSLTHSLDSAFYRYPLTLKTKLPAAWEAVRVTQGEKDLNAKLVEELGVRYATYEAVPNAGDIKIMEAE
jgi:peptidoglycan/xylan/chitin deacetylase (PgdA/CDA1 family)